MQSDSVQQGDTLTYANFRNSRIGFNSFVFSNQVFRHLINNKGEVHAVIGQNFLYNKRLTGGGGRFVQEDYYFRLEPTVLIAPNLWTGVRAHTMQFKAIGNSNTRAEALLRWLPAFKGLSLYSEISAGAMADQRLTNQNSGPSFRAFLSGSAYSKDSTTNYTWQGQVSQAYISPRQMGVWAAHAGLSQQVKGFAQTKIGVGYLRRRVDDFFSGQIQQIQSDSLEATLFIGSHINKRFDFQSDNRILIPIRKFTYSPHDTTPLFSQDSRFQQTEVSSHQQLSYTSSKIKQIIGLDFFSRTRTYSLNNNLGLDNASFNKSLVTEKIKNISENTVTYNYQAKWQVDSRNTLSGSWSGSLLRVNTYSILNDQDRDETFYSGDISWGHRWLKTLRTSARVSGSLRNVLFIESTQSAQNYVERVLRFEPTVGYTLGRVRLNATYGLWATYNVRQFSSEEAKNRANRVWIQTYILRYQASSQWYFLADAMRRENRIAQLNWGKFKESPIDTVILTEFHGRAGHTFQKRYGAGKLSAEVGYKLFRQDRHNLAGVSIPGNSTRQAALHTITLQQGPTAALVWEVPGYGRLVLDGWLQPAVSKFKYKLSNQIFIGQTYSAEQLNNQERHVYFFFNLTGQFLIH